MGPTARIAPGARRLAPAVVAALVLAALLVPGRPAPALAGPTLAAAVTAGDSGAGTDVGQTLPDSTAAPAPAAAPAAGGTGSGSGAGLQNGLALTPPMGFNDWNAVGCSVSEDFIKQTADLMVSSGLAAAGYRYVNIDDCWALPNRDAAGNLVADPAKFPDGIKGTADYVHSRGLELGLYDDSGSHTCSTHGFPGSLGHEQQDADLFASWGVDYLKEDDCNVPAVNQNRSDTVVRYTLMRDALLRTGRPIVFSLCEKGDWAGDPASWSPLVGNLWRTTFDIHPDWGRIKSIIDLDIPKAAAAHPGAWNDPDMLEVGNPPKTGSGLPPLTDTEQKTHFSMWAEMAAPLIIGTRLASATPATMAILLNQDVIAVDQDPLGIQGVEIENSNGLRVLSRPLVDGDYAVALYNETDTDATISTTAARVGLPGERSYRLTDLWSKAVTTSRGRISARVPAHGTVLLRVHAVDPGTAATVRVDLTRDLGAAPAEVAELTGSGQLMPATVATARDLTATAVRSGDGHPRVLLADRGHRGQTVTVSLRAGVSSDPAHVVTVEEDADRSGRRQEVPGHDGVYSFRIRSGSTVLVTLPSPSDSIFVSPWGDDRNPGTERRPVQSLDRARELVRMADHDMRRDVVVHLAGGTYDLADTLVLDQRDSGTNGHRVIWQAEDDDRPAVLSGGVPVTGWTLTDASRNLWSAPAPAGLGNTRQLYVDGVRADRTRGLPPVTLTPTTTGYTTSAPTMATWRNPGDIEFVWTGGNDLWSWDHRNVIGAWTEPRCPVAAIDATSVTMAQPCWDNTTKRVKFPPNLFGGRTVNLVGGGSSASMPRYVENAYELLGTPGQFYLDRSAHKIYYVPRPGENLARTHVVAPVLQALVTGQGTPGDPIQNVAFQGVQFSYATWLRPSSSEGLSEIQANYTLTTAGAYASQGLCQFATEAGLPQGTCPFGAWTREPGNVSFAYARSASFLDDAFVHLGAAGIGLGDGSQSVTVRGSVFTDISGNGVEVGGVTIPDPTPDQVVRDNQIVDNHLYDLPVEYHGGVAIVNGWTQHDTIEHNQIDHTAYSAISMSWGGWPDKVQQQAQPNPSHDNLVARNLIFDQMLTLDDGGAIYTNGTTGTSMADGEKIVGNVIHDQFGAGHAIYTDNGATWITIQNNVIVNTDFDNWGSRHTDYRPGATGDDPTLIQNNFWQQGNADSSALNVTLTGNQIVDRVDQAPDSIVDAAGLEDRFKGLLHRTFSRPSAPEPPLRVAALAGDGYAYVAWNPPVRGGTSGVDSYTVTSSGGEKVTVPADVFMRNAYVKIGGLTDGTAYTFTVTAHNHQGSSSPSMPSRPVTPAAATVTPPTAPVSVSADPGSGTASVHFKDPAANKTTGSDGGSPVVAYTISAIRNGRTVRTITVTGRTVLTLGTSHSDFAVIGGLTNGQTYEVTVTASNAAGASSPAITTVTPSPYPHVPAPPSAAPATVVLDGGRLVQNQQLLAAGDPTLKSELAALVGTANKDLTAGPWSVMDKTQVPPSGDRHDYLSEAPFWWPGPNGGCPYVQRDGVRNPAADAISDHQEIGQAWAAAHELALAWFYTGDQRYAQRAELVLRTWFLDPATAMNPNLEFAQIIPCPGQTHLGIGIIESSEQIEHVLDSAALLDSGAPGWTAADHSGMAAWLTSFQTWLATSAAGQAESKARNNHGSWYDAQAAGIALYLGQKSAAASIVTGAETSRIATQISADGSQPLEMARTMPWHYSNFNAQALCQVAEIGRHAGVDVWGYTAPGGGSLRAAVDFLIPAAEHGQSAWPKPELGTFDQSAALPKLHAAADEADDSAARAAVPLVPAPAGGDLWQLVPAC